MKTNIYIFTITGLVWMLSSCSTSKNSFSKVSENPPENWMMEGWFSMNKTKTWSDVNGAYSMTCPTFSMGAEIPIGNYGELLEDKFNMYCGEILGYKSSKNLQHVQMVRLEEKESLNGIDMSKWKVTEFTPPISLGMDFATVEHKEVWIGPELVEVPCASPMAPADCKEKRHQLQEGHFFRGGRWLISYDIWPMKDFEPGHIYRVSYAKVYPPKMLLQMDGPGYEIKDFKVLKKIRF